MQEATMQMMTLLDKISVNRLSQWICGVSVPGNFSIHGSVPDFQVVFHNLLDV